jgi:hypothetical protein
MGYFFTTVIDTQRFSPARQKIHWTKGFFGMFTKIVANLTDVVKAILLTFSVNFPTVKERTNPVQKLSIENTDTVETPNLRTRGQHKFLSLLFMHAFQAGFIKNTET